MPEAEPVSFDGWVCPLPLRDSPTIVMGHGGGGAMSAELVEHLFLPAFGEAADAELGDSAVMSVAGARLAFSTDSYVVRPLFFPGGSIGDLAVNGTVNDLAMSGATPLALSTAFILEEGTALSELGRVAEALGSRCAGGRCATRHRGHEGRRRGTRRQHLRQHRRDRGARRRDRHPSGPGPQGRRGDRQRRHRRARRSGDELPGGAGVRHRGRERHRTSQRARRRDAGDRRGHPRAPRPHPRWCRGVAQRDREGVQESGSAWSSAAADPATRSATPAGCSDSTRSRSPTRASCWRSSPRRRRPGARGDAGHEYGRSAALIGVCVDEHPGMVVARTGLGAPRVVDLPLGEQLPRIC